MDHYVQYAKDHEGLMTRSTGGTRKLFFDFDHRNDENITFHLQSAMSKHHSSFYWKLGERERMNIIWFENFSK